MGLFPSTDGSDPRKASRDAADAARVAQQEAAKLREDLDHQTLITVALWELLKQKCQLSDADLVAAVREVDMRDGKVDGRYVRAPEPCPKCKRPVTLSTNTCAYCGTKVERSSPF
ncbi:MAG TPA: zinc ribbon domain-containing protein [Planctomycetota bacterium]|nr:zinc ribbon domain-containing protein [Planctomycetota bacterium]